METTMITGEIEYNVCTRCSGTGQHSFCTLHGTTCFKCHGRGKVLTARGKVVSAYIRSLRWATIRAEQVKPGQVGIFSSSVFTGATRPFLVEAVSVTDQPHFVTFTLAGRKHTLSMHMNAQVQVRTEATDAATFQAGMELQTTLTKAGKPTKKTTAAARAFIESL